MDSRRKPESNSINWAELRAAAITIGVREAGRQAAINLPPQEQERFVQRVMKRSQREGWIEHKQALNVETTQAKPLSANVRTGTEAIESKLLEDGKETKISLSKGLRKAAKQMEEMPGQAIYNSADKAKHLVGAASQIHGWEQKQEAGINLNVLSISGEMAVQINQGSR